jgi:hypothetical protein
MAHSLSSERVHLCLWPVTGLLGLGQMAPGAMIVPATDPGGRRSRSCVLETSQPRAPAARRRKSVLSMCVLYGRSGSVSQPDQHHLCNPREAVTGPTFRNIGGLAGT